MRAKTAPDLQTKTVRAAVFHPDPRDRLGRTGERALDEALSLARALDLTVDLAEVLPLRRPDPATLIASGKVGELARKLDGIEVAVINAELSPVQQRNLEKRWNVKVLDRTGLILEIFADRARTREGVLQVDLARLTYQKSRLVRGWTHLERQRGGTGKTGGPGETQIESDRRAITDEIQKLKAQLLKVRATRELHRAARRKVPWPVIALVGYTNAGKSTLFNRLTGAGVLARDMLFATLDPTLRSIALPGGRKAMLSDTVGFISDLPTELVAAFRATLEEVLEADLILHVRDIAHPETEQQARDVARVLDGLGLGEEAQDRMIEVWNKADLLPEPGIHAGPGKVLVSALSGQGTGDLLSLIADRLAEPVEAARLKLSFAEGRRRAWLFDQLVITKETETQGGYAIDVCWTARQRAEYERL
jgi:GTP-binding protein HflX